MKTSLFTIVVISIVLAFGCKKDEENDNANKEKPVGTITLNNESFDVYAGSSAVQLFVDDPNTNGSISITGSNSANSLIISLAVEYPTAAGISGTYENGDFSSSSHVFSPWLTQVSVTTNDGSTNNNYNEPDGTLQVTHNSGNNYTVDFSMTFQDTLVVSGDITMDFIEQMMNM